MGYKANRMVETSAKTFAIVEALADSEQMGVSELATEFEMSKGVVHNHLSTLRELGYVEKIEGKYKLSPRFLCLGHQERSKSPLFDPGRSAVNRLASQFETPVFLARRHDVDAIVTYSSGTSPTLDIEAGTTFPVGASLVGIAMLAFCSPETQDRLLETNKASGEFPADAGSLQTVVEEGYLTGPMTALDHRGVAVPVVDDQQCRGGICAVLIDVDEAGTNQLINELLTVRRGIEQRFDNNWDANQSFTTEKHAWFGG